MSGFKSQYVNVIDTNDIKRADLKIWRDYDQDGVTDRPDSVTGAGRELFTLAQLGIVELSLTNPALNVTTPTGAQLLSSGDVTVTRGRVTKMFEAVFQSSDVDTRFGGEAGAAVWADSTLNVNGFGSVTDLSVAMANDIELGELATTQAAAMTVANPKTLRLLRYSKLEKLAANCLSANNDVELLPFRSNTRAYLC